MFQLVIKKIRNKCIEFAVVSNYKERNQDNFDFVK